MKRLWIAAALLAAVFFATLYNTHYLDKFTSNMSQLLMQAEERAQSGDWDGATVLTNQAYQVWQAHTRYLHILLRHSDIDDVETGYWEVLNYIFSKESGEYPAANARLVSRIGLLYEAEQLTLKNVL